MVIVAASATGTVALLADRLDAGDRGREGGKASVHSRAGRIGAGHSMTVLRLPRIGRFTVACGQDRRSTVSFTPDHLLPTADVIVSGGRGVESGTLQPGRTKTAWRRPVAALSETWQIAPFAAAGVRVTTVHVAARRLRAREAFGCAASASAVIGPDQGATRTADVTVERARAHRLLAGEPYLGVSCARPNSIACDRVGLAVWLRRPASRVTAEIDGRRFALDDPEASAPPKMLAGYLQPAGLRSGALRVPAVAGDRWFGAGDVRARVRLWVSAGGRTRTVRVRVPLRAGWG